ncbi:YopT-type cysteine protease domain-containing protein [Spartinivicinus poritis]|uniref:YopT-type cysteine protease domain-containing protein n=1 Tax=Spartinivicinus poritis TaxID=2994640 RepID=A0ABT5U4L3_9GAMM|nr:YopT-type cysteine protease domain-containing protein [Spartinivicinus sp. A2-2]MDE1461301.1 YopT-type cysteine protease domain-containing protein [Spartinivicinus sp. A2-2]
MTNVGGLSTHLINNQPPTAFKAIDNKPKLSPFGCTISLLDSGNNTFRKSVFRLSLHKQSSELKRLKKAIKLTQTSQNPKQLQQLEQALELWIKKQPKEVKQRGKLIPQLKTAIKEHKQLADPNYQAFEQKRRNEVKTELTNLAKKQQLNKQLAEITKEMLELQLGLKFTHQPRSNADIREAIVNAFSPQTVSYVLHRYPELKEDGPINVSKLMSSINSLESLVNPGVITAQKSNAQLITPFQQKRFLGDRTFGKEGICAALSAKWLTTQHTNINFYEDIGFVDGIKAHAKAEGHEEVMNLAIQYYGGQSGHKNTNAHWSADVPHGFYALLNYFKNYQLSMDIQKSDTVKGADLSTISKPGLYYLAIHNSKGGGHGLAAKVAASAQGEIAGYTLFDPNYGEFHFTNEQQFKQFTYSLINQLYPELKHSTLIIGLK